jgi:two-component sensor histidine kinase
MAGSDRARTPPDRSATSGDAAAGGRGRGPGRGGAGEERRLATLRRTGLLDAPPEPAFDRLTRLACRLLRTPVALVSLVDADRQFFAGQRGLAEPWAGLRQTPLSHSFCRHVVAGDAPLVVADARGHPLVCDSPAVAELGVAAYLGAPLRAPGGLVLGSLCVIDTAPRAWAEEDVAIVRDLAEAAATEVALRLELAERTGAEAVRSAAIERERQRLEAVVEGIAEAVVAVFPKEGLWLRNAAWLPLHGFAGFDELPGRGVTAFAHLFETLSPDGSPVPHRDLPITRVLRGEDFSDVEVRLRRTDKAHERWVSYNGTAVRDPDGGDVSLAVLTMRDVTTRKAAEERHRLLLAELSHRVKNTLAVVQGIANRSLSGERTLGEAREALAKRLRALANAHTLLTASEWRGASLRALAAAELDPYRGRVAMRGRDLALGPKAAQGLALILHELATNAAKHGALSVPEGRAELAWDAGEAVLRLTWREAGGPEVRPPARRGFGRLLIEEAAVHDLAGRARLEFRRGGWPTSWRSPPPASRPRSRAAGGPGRCRARGGPSRHRSGWPGTRGSGRTVCLENFLDREPRASEVP